MGKSAVVIAGGDISYKFNVLNSRYSSPALIPINSRTLGQYVLDAYHAYGYDSIFLVVDSSVLQTVETELYETCQKTNTRLIGVTASGSVIQTLQMALEHPEIQNEVTVNVVTTIPSREIGLNELLVDEEIKENQGWSGIIVADGVIELVKKQHEQKPCFAFQGVFSMEKALLQTAIQELNSNDLIDLVEELFNRKWNPSLIHSRWIDCGHEENYFKARNELINSRNFNRLTVKGNTITKRSANKEKIEAEIAYYRNLPGNLQTYFPSLIESGNTETEGFYTMTYLNLPNLSELILYWDVSDSNYTRIFKNIEAALMLFRQHATQFSKTEYEQFYTSKTRARINSYKESLKDNALRTVLFEHTHVQINGQSYLNFDQLERTISHRLDSLYEQSVFCLVHGDLCFNNMLANLDDYSIKLIDPRGSFSGNQFSNYGDLAYDLAKLAHSSMFYYDYIVADLFRLEQTEDAGFLLTFNQRENDALLKTLTRGIIEKHGFAFNDIKMIVGLLFLSMTPLHTDSETRQLAMYLNGLQIVNESLNG